MKKDSIKNIKRTRIWHRIRKKIQKEEGKRHHDDEKKYFFRMKKKGERAFSDMLRFVVVIYFRSASVAGTANGKYSQKASMYTFIYTRK